MDKEQLLNCFKELGLNQREVSELLEVDLRTIHRWIKEPENIPKVMILLLKCLLKLNKLELQPGDKLRFLINE